ncbi:hypothetical protein FRC10_011749, partial [Ceratobasidium sp. 414]
MCVAVNPIKFRHRPDMASGVLTSVDAMMVPRSVHKLLEKGFLTHLPWTNLTDRTCLHEFNIMRNEEQVVRIGPNGMAITAAPDLPPNNPDEKNLSLAEYLQASKRFLYLIAAYQPDILRYWDAHVQIVMTHPLRDTHWLLVLGYCISVRKRSCHKPIDMSIYQRDIFNDIREKNRDSKAGVMDSAPPAAST